MRREGKLQDSSATRKALPSSAIRAKHDSRPRASHAPIRCSSPKTQPYRTASMARQHLLSSRLRRPQWNANKPPGTNASTVPSGFWKIGLAALHRPRQRTSARSQRTGPSGPFSKSGIQTRKAQTTVPRPSAPRKATPGREAVVRRAAADIAQLDKHELTNNVHRRRDNIRSSDLAKGLFFKRRLNVPAEPTMRRRA